MNGALTAPSRLHGAIVSASGQGVGFETLHETVGWDHNLKDRIPVLKIGGTAKLASPSGRSVIAEPVPTGGRQDGQLVRRRESSGINQHLNATGRGQTLGVGNRVEETIAPTNCPAGV